MPGYVPGGVGAFPDPYHRDPLSWGHVVHRWIPSLPGYCGGSDGSLWTHLHCHGLRKIVESRDGWSRLEPMANPRGYLFVRLKFEGRTRAFMVHCLVLEAFSGPCPPGLQCRHLDGNRKNNRITNLKWGTPQENADDRAIHGTNLVGSDNPTALLSEVDIPVIFYQYAQGMTMLEIAAEFGVSFTVIRNVLERKNWRHISCDLVPERTDQRRAVFQRVLPRGDAHKGARLREKDIPEIRRLAAQGMSIRKIADQFSVGYCAIQGVLSGKTWRHVP